MAIFVSNVLVAIAVKASSPEQTLRGQLFDSESLVIDWGEVCIGVILALLCSLNPLLALVALTPVVLLQRGLLHDQLSAAARLDSKTALLNAPSWEREANSEITRAVRTRTALSVLLLDLDHFKQVNDFFGHMAGDDVIRAVAGVLRAQTREYDLSCPVSAGTSSPSCSPSRTARRRVVRPSGSSATSTGWACRRARPTSRCRRPSASPS